MGRKSDQEDRPSKHFVQLHFDTCHYGMGEGRSPHLDNSDQVDMGGLREYSLLVPRGRKI